MLLLLALSVLVVCQRADSLRRTGHRHLLQTVGTSSTTTAVFVPDFAAFPKQTIPSKWCVNASECKAEVVLAEKPLLVNGRANLANVTDSPSPAPLAGTYRLSYEEAQQLLDTIVPGCGRKDGRLLLVYARHSLPKHMARMCCMRKCFVQEPR
jgi:hypothetical protein